MFLQEYENFNSQYEKGIKSITIISSRPRIIAYPVLGIQERNKHSNKLLFDKKGRLTQSIYWSMNTKYKILYIFSPSGKLITALKLDWQGDLVKEISEFRYDKAGRIQIERIHSNSDSFGYCETKFVYTFTENTEQILMTSDDYDEDGYISYTSYDNNNRKIECKVVTVHDDLMSWNKYEYEGEIEKSFSLSEDGKKESESVYRYFPKLKNLETGFELISADDNYMIEFLYTFNSKEQWITMAILQDGNLNTFEERIFEYY